MTALTWLQKCPFRSRSAVKEVNWFYRVPLVQFGGPECATWTPWIKQKTQRGIFRRCCVEIWSARSRVSDADEIFGVALNAWQACSSAANNPHICSLNSPVFSLQAYVNSASGGLSQVESVAFKKHAGFHQSTAFRKALVTHPTHK